MASLGYGGLANTPTRTFSAKEEAEVVAGLFSRTGIGIGVSIGLYLLLWIMGG